MWVNTLSRAVYRNTLEVRQAFPNVSFTTSMLPEELTPWNIAPLVEGVQPSYSRATEKLVPVTPVQINGVWTRPWAVVQLTPQEQAEVAQVIQAEIVYATQLRLDTFAQTRNYDSILSACTYATSSVPKFAAEGQYCVDARDQTWAALYTVLGEVLAGQRPMPNGFADVEPELPSLEWPQ